ncbi:MAG: hypothetical protein P4M11_03290 [Candidatus Pacebacteria bacterium]|nr:hypothetical protein [Candidatus Paceibacterota bacterium]
MLFGVLKLIYYMIRRFLLSTYEYFTRDFFNIISMLSVALSLCLVFYWCDSDKDNHGRIMILVINVTPTFDDESSSMTDSYGDLTEVARLYAKYSILAALNTLFVFLKLIKFFSFSRSLYTLVTVISRAKVSLFFFVLMFMIVRFIVWGDNE